jgi:hypothetical protein
MHLREYTNDELVEALQRAGFGRIWGVLNVPRTSGATVSRSYLRLLIALEHAVAHDWGAPLLALARQLARPGVFLVAERGHAARE